MSTERWPTPSARTADDTPEQAQRRRASLWRNVAYLTSLGWLIVVPIVAGTLLGWLLDGALGTRPYATILLLSAGIGVALIEGLMAGARALRIIRRD